MFAFELFMSRVLYVAHVFASAVLTLGALARCFGSRLMQEDAPMQAAVSLMMATFMLGRSLQLGKLVDDIRAARKKLEDS